MTLQDALDAVHDERSFLEFARLLANDRADADAGEKADPLRYAYDGANGWQSGSISAFLSSAIAWAESTNVGLTQGLSADNPWKRFAVFLYCGKIYE